MSLLLTYERLDTMSDEEWNTLSGADMVEALDMLHERYTLAVEQCYERSHYHTTLPNEL